MEKIISLFQRNYQGDRLVRDEIVAGAEWVLAGEGVGTRKWDGTCCMVRDGKLYKRYDAKRGKQPPNGFEPVQEPDEKTGHWPGWLPVGDGPEDRWHREAWASHQEYCPDGTYELCGPKVQGNPEHLPAHVLIDHRGPLTTIHFAPERNYAAIRAFLESEDIEGIVWHHPDGRMVKIKAKDFGIKRSPLAAPSAGAVGDQE